MNKYMTKEGIKEFLDNTKVYVNGKSKEIQEKLLSIGYMWSDGESEVKYTDKPFLFVCRNSGIAYTDNMEWFVNDPSREITAEQILSLKLTKLYRPFKNQEECWDEMLKHKPFGWICVNSKYYQILGVSDIGIRFANEFSTFDGDMDYTFLDGTPFGIEV